MLCCLKGRKCGVKRAKKSNMAKKIVISILVIIFLACLSYLVIHFYFSNQEQKVNEDIQKEMDNIPIGELSSKYQKIQELQKQNADIKGWIKIENTHINYPLLQTDNNDFYLTHNYKKEKSVSGSIFIHPNSDLKDKNSNVIIYGHQMDNGTMFGDLHKYKEQSFYEEHSKITITTEDTEADYEIVCVFKSRVFYQDEKDVFRYYQCYDFNIEEEYNEYINNCKAIQLYDTKQTAKYGEQLITLITCEYSQENGRIVVVAKKV